MAAQGPDSSVRVCERCFATIPAASEFCEECGAPLADDPRGEGSDSAIYPELARANLLRMRGEYRAAEEVCLALLRRMPNNATAHGLLGDICAERNDLERAAEWYELALDLTPESVAIAQKLSEVQRRIQEHEAAMTAQQLGLPTSRPRILLFTLSALAVIVITGVAAYLIGRGMPDWSSRHSNVVDVPIVLPPKDAAGPGPSRVDAEGAKAAAPPEETSSVGRTEGESRLLTTLAQRLPEGVRLVSASQDPRNLLVTLTFTVGEGDNPGNIGARIAAAAMEVLPETPSVTVRAIRAGKLVFVADAQRAAVASASVPDWHEASSKDPEGFARSVLSNVWTAGATGTNTSPLSEAPGRGPGDTAG